MWRSLLFIPALNERFLAKAAGRGADAVILDLEASIAPGRKQEARKALPSAIDQLVGQNLEVMVRINTLWRAALSDLEVTVRRGVKAIVLPDCRSVTEIQAIDGVVTELEQERELDTISLIPMIESAQGVLDSRSIAAASARVVGLSFGVEDYLMDTRGRHDAQALAGAAQMIALAARAAGKVPLVVPESIANLDDMPGFEAAAQAGRAMGSAGGLAVHPKQVAVLNRVFTPSDEELAWAQRVVGAAALAEQRGDGVLSLDGRMIDLPVVLRAKQLIELYKRFEKNSVVVD